MLPVSIIEISPKKTYEDTKLLWDNLEKLFGVKFIPYEEDYRTYCSEGIQRHVFDFSGTDCLTAYHNENRTCFVNRLSTIDPVLVKNLFKGDTQLFDIIERIKLILPIQGRSAACITIDDPALYSFIYGYIHFKELVETCKHYGVCCCIAVVPIDLWFYNKKLIKYLHENKKHISLCMHGITHLRNDLNRTWNVEKCVSYLNYGIQKIKTFERKSGLKVSRLIVPPHEKISKQMIEAVAHTEISGIITAGRIYGYTTELKKDDYLAGMEPVYWALNKVPILQRDGLPECSDRFNEKLRVRVKNRAILNQAILFAAHHNDFKNIPEIIRNINTLASELSIPWVSIHEIEKAILDNSDRLIEKDETIGDEKTNVPNFAMVSSAYIRRWTCMIRDRMSASKP